MHLNRLSLKDKALFDKHLSLGKHSLSVYSFANIYIWNKLFLISWVVINNNLCVFFQDKIGSFLYLEPLGRNIDSGVLKEVFKKLDSLNKNKCLSHIENIEEANLHLYRSESYEIVFKSHDYLCKRDDLASLKGNKFKSKRASFNYFTKHYDYKFSLLTLEDRKACLDLYDHWSKQRESQSFDQAYKYMLKDSRVSLFQALKYYKELKYYGFAVKIDKQIRGFTFGFQLNNDTFCILYEVTDLSIKGLAQFIFCEFSKKLKNFKYINIIDDSVLQCLKKVKNSYHPEKLISSYIIRRHG